MPHLAIFGGIIYVDRPLLRGEKIAGILIYTIFAWLNYRIMLNQLDLATSISQEMARLASDPCCQNNQVVALFAEQLERGDLDQRYRLLWVGHVVLYLIVLASMVFDQALSRRAADE